MTNSTAPARTARQLATAFELTQIDQWLCVNDLNFAEFANVYNALTALNVPFTLELTDRNATFRFADYAEAKKVLAAIAA